MLSDRMNEQFPADRPIFTEEIINAFPEFSRAYVFRLIKKAEASRELVRFANGVYFIPRKTFFGLSTITAESVIERRYLSWNDEKFGIYGGLKLLNLFSVTTQVPNVIEIVTNNETTRRREIMLDGRKFVLKRSRFEINKENADAYAVLQLFSDLNGNDTLNDFAKRRVSEFILKKGISQNRLITLALSFPARTMKNLMRSGVLNAVARG